MKLGMLTACMPERPLEEIAKFAAGAGYETLEVAAWPSIGDRPFTASHIKADQWDEAEADRVRSALEANGLEVLVIDTRVEQMFAGGFVQEVRDLITRYGALGRTARQAVGYREVVEHLEGSGFRVLGSEQNSEFKVQGSKSDFFRLAACIDRVKVRTRQFARRQETWFRALSECTPVPMQPEFDPAQVAAAIAP